MFLVSVIFLLLYPEFLTVQDGVLKLVQYGTGAMSFISFSLNIIVYWQECRHGVDYFVSMWL